MENIAQAYEVGPARQCVTTDLYPERLSFENAGEEFDRARGVLPGHGVGKQPPAARTGIVEESAMGQTRKTSN